METCVPENEVNLITHLNVHPNQKDDAAILVEDLTGMVEKTPDLNEAHLDGGFGSPAVDIVAKKEQVNIIQTAVKGNVAKVPIKVQGNEDIGFTVSCPHPEQEQTQGIKLKKNYKANFDLDKCENCPFQQNCPAYKKRLPKKRFAVFRFDADTALRQQRHQAISKIPKERRTLRSGVENLMGLMHRCEKHTGKLKVRGLFNCKLYVFAMGISINFERIFRHLNAFFAFFSTFCSIKYLRGNNTLSIR